MKAVGVSGRTHWNSIAQSWHLYGEPLRPSEADLAVFSGFMNRYAESPSGSESAALLLGVTPEIATMAWPAGTVVTGVDRSPEMIKIVWPGDVPGVRQARCEDWFALTPPISRYRIVIGDGSINVMGFPNDLRRLLAELRQVAQPGALLILRSFVLPAAAETVASLARLAGAGKAGAFHAFKFRLAMALQSSPEEGVPLDEVWQSWHRLERADKAVSKKNGWAPDVVGTIDLFRGKQIRLSFPSLGQLIAVLEAERASVLDCHPMTYEMGDRCPILACRL